MFDPVPQAVIPLLATIDGLRAPTPETIANAAALAATKDEEYFAADPSARQGLFGQARALAAVHRFLVDDDESVLDVAYETVIGVGLGSVELRAAMKQATAPDT